MQTEQVVKISKSEALAQTTYGFSGVRMRCLLTGKETAGALSLFENISNGNSGTPIHQHAFEDETISVLEGEMVATVDGMTRVLKTGEAVFMPRNVPHQLRNASGSPSRYMILCTPSGFENFVAEAGRVLQDGEQPSSPSVAEIDRMKQIAPTFGILLLKPAL